VLNYIWLALVVLAVAIGGWNNRLGDVTAGALDGAKTAGTIALGLIGIMALWLGVMRSPSGPGSSNASPAAFVLSCGACFPTCRPNIPRWDRC
jgi:spore maturation protein A